MNKRPNPFMPNPYPTQPPLPAGPPPPGPAQQTQQYDYSAYWAAAAAAQQNQSGAQTTPQWAPPTVGAQPPQPQRTQEQNALYANYGYGGAAGQQQAMLAAQQQRPAAPYWTPPVPGYAPVAAAAPYPYPQQPPTAYQPQPPPPVIPYTPQAPPMPMYQHQHQHPPQVAPPPPPQPQRRFQPPQQPQQQQPHHLPAPPAKRPRFDSGPPNPNNNNPNWRNNNNSSSNGIPTAPAQHGNFPPQQPGFERFTGSRGGRGGAAVSSSNNRGRGFNRGNFRHGHGNNPPRGPSGYRNPGPTGAPYGPRHGLPANPTKREREAKRERERDREGSYAESEGAGVERHGGKRTLTDFRIVGVECGAIGWEWGVLSRVKDDKDKDEKLDEDKDKDKPAEESKVKDEPTSPVKLASKNPQPAPSRLRIYFHSASDPEADALPRKRKKDADEEDEEGGVRKKVQGGEDTPRDPEKGAEKDGEKDEHEDTAPEVQQENVFEDKHEDLGDEQDADGEDDVDHIPKPEQEDPHFPEHNGFSDEQDAVSQKPPPTPTPGESTPVDTAHHESTPAPPVEGQAPVENGSGEPHVEGSNAEPNPPVDPTQPTEHPDTTAHSAAHSTAPSITQDGVVSSEAGDVSVVEDSLVESHGLDHESEAHDAADMSASTIDEPIAFPSLDNPSVLKTQPQVPDRSANRISISYANSTRRLVIDADVVKKVRIVRAKARVEITLAVEVVKGDNTEETKDANQSVKEEPETGVKENKDEKLVLGEHDRFRGVLVEVYNESTQRYELITPYAASQGDDLTIPDLSKIDRTPSEITIIVHLDRDKPLTETKWVKTGDLDEWLSNEFGPLRPDPSGRANWSGKIQVADPDPAPTITTLMDAWCGHTMVGQPKERRRFVRQHMSNIDHVLEILLRLVRGERATAGGGGGGGQHDRGGQQQTHVSLAVLAIFRVATDYGARAGIERQVVEERVSEIVRSLPTHLVYKSLDGMFREWSFTQKKGEKGGAKDKS